MRKRPLKGVPEQAPRAADLIKVIRQLVVQQKVTYSRHVLEERLDERGFDLSDIKKVLNNGDIDGAIRPGKNPGEWRCLVVGNVYWSPREVGVATVVVQQERLIIATVEWIDP